MSAKMPPLNQMVGVCAGCNHWQVDFGPRPSRYADDANAALMLAAEAHHEHLYGDCVAGTEGRIKVLGQWVERPDMADGDKPQGVMAFQALPRWWVWR